MSPCTGIDNDRGSGDDLCDVESLFVTSQQANARFVGATSYFRLYLMVVFVQLMIGGANDC
jgi:hypothetical protein